MLGFVKSMKLVASLLGLKKKIKSKTVAEFQRESLVEEGAQQFKKLIDLGVGVPVTLL